VTAYYNENDPKAAAWLRELMWEGCIAMGDVDERSIEDVRPSELAGYTQCHFFAGIGGWSYALRLAGWPDDRAVWTGSCPCQPFSAAGKGKGFADERHLWPSWFWLIAQCKPRHVFGEQVANALPWLDLVQSDLEAKDYAFGAAVIGAHSVGAPHIRQRLYWVADTIGERRARLDALLRREDSRRLAEKTVLEITRSSSTGDLAHAECAVGRDAIRPPSGDAAAGAGASVELGRRGDTWRSELLPCIDGKARPIEPGTFPLAHGVSSRVGLLRGYGNAIVPQVAAAFIEAYGEVA
jgi:DNA (cytosine-5)-methyltransferase 1